MPNDNVKDMVNSLTSGDNVKAQDAFKNALSDKIGQALDDKRQSVATDWLNSCLLYTSPSPRDRTRSRMPSSA